MTIEATEEQGKKGGRKPRGGNTLVDKMTGSLDIEGETPEDAALREAQRIAAAATAGDTPEQPQQPEPPPQPPALFERPVATPPKLSPKAAREEGLADRMRQNKPSPSTKKMGELGRKLPGAERAKIHKRVDGGNLAYIGEYTENDLAQSQDIESFIGRYLGPKYGPGEYQITGVDAHGREFDMGIVQLLNPLGDAKEAQPQVSQEVPVMGQLVTRLMDKALQPPPPPQVVSAPSTPAKDPVKTLSELLDLQQRMAPPTPSAAPAPKDNALLLAIVGGLTTVASSLVTVLAQPKPVDPLMAALLKKLTDDEPRGGGGALPPPPPPPPDPTEQLKNLAAVVQSLRGPEVAKTSDDRLVEYLMRDRMSPGDVLKLVNEVKGERGTDDFKKSMENIGIMLNAVNQLRAHTEPGAGAGFWDAVGALFQNRELAGTIADTIRSKKTPEQQVTQQQPRALPDPLVLRARELAAKRLEIEAAELMKREQALRGSSEASPVQRQPSARPTTMAPTIESAVPQMPELEPQAPSQSKLPQLPSDIGDFINSYVEAKDEASLVETTVRLLFALRETEDWRPYSEVIFKLLTQSDKARFLHYMASFFVGLRTINLIEDGIAQRIMQALANNFSTIAETVTAELEGGDGDGEGGGEDGEGDGEGEGESEGGDEDLLKLGEEEPLS